MNVTANVARLHRKNYLDGDNTIPGPCMSGQLTKYGYDQHLINGAYLKQQYSGLLPSNLVRSSLNLRSTDVPRTLQSAQALLRGMYPWTNQANPSATNFVDMYTVDAAREWLYPNPGNCPLLAKFEAEGKQSSAYTGYISSTLTPLMAQLSKYYGVAAAGMTSPIATFDCLSAHKCHKFPVPGDLPDDLYNQIVAAMEFEYKYTYNYPDRTTYGALAMGRAHYDVLRHFRDMAFNSTARSTEPVFRLLSAHDTSVMPFLNAIGAWDGIWAPYASLVQMELWTPTQSSHSQSPLIRYIYNRKELTLPGCQGVFCPLEQYGELVAPLVRTNYAAACAISPHEAKDIHTTANLGVYTNDGW